ncbi:unnamed protein product [Symbiodinium sp. KB8]|nr:unnamed protein product [Symbiodinium sp. KB8]
MYRHDSRSFLLGAGVYASSSSSSSRLAQGGAEKPSQRRKRAACSAARVLGGNPVPIAVASGAEEGGEYTRLVFAQCADSVPYSAGLGTAAAPDGSILLGSEICGGPAPDKLEGIYSIAVDLPDDERANDVTLANVFGEFAILKINSDESILLDYTAFSGELAQMQGPMIQQLNADKAEQLCFIGFNGDAALANRPGGVSTGGYLLGLIHPNDLARGAGPINLVS